MKCDRCGRGEKQLGLAALYHRPPFGTFCWDCFQAEFPWDDGHRTNEPIWDDVDPVCALMAPWVALFLVLGARSPTNGLAVIALKLVLVACFAAGLAACIYLWRARSWAVVAVPFIGLGAQLGLNWFGQTVLHWSVSMGFV